MTIERPDDDVPPANQPVESDPAQPVAEQAAPAPADADESSVAGSIDTLSGDEPPAGDAPTPDPPSGDIEAPVAAESLEPAVTFVVRASLGGGRVSERIAGLESAHERFSELADEHPNARISLYGPGGTLLRRRPADPGSCRFCEDPAAGTWPATAFGSDTLTRRRDVIALCPGHHAALTAGPAGYRNGPWLWRPGHSIS